MLNQSRDNPIINKCMSNSLSASTEGLARVDRARKRLGWTKTSTARWWQDAHTSRATLRRFWQGDRIQRDAFIAICQTVGIHDWEAIADSSNLDSECIPDETTPQLDWYEAPDIEGFYGRDRELQQLEQWIVHDRCKFITIAGIAGIGKTALALALADRLQSNFEVLMWRSLQRTPSLLSLLDSLLNAIDGTVVRDIPQGTAQVIQYLKQHRCLLILDGFDAALLNGKNSYEWNEFIQILSRDRHKSCAIVTSREQPSAIAWSLKNSRCLNLQGLQKANVLKLLKSRRFTGKELGLSALIHLYRGNPLAIELVAPFIQSVFGGNIAAFLNQNSLIVGDRLRVILKQQLERLSDLERDILYWLAIWQEPISFGRLQTHFIISIDPAEVLEGIAGLERQSLLEKWAIAEQYAFTLQPLVMKIVTDELVDRVAQEIDRVVQSNKIGDFKVMRSHGLLRPGTDDLAGDRILNQLREKLWRMYGATLPPILHKILLLLKGKSPLAIGYIGFNAIALLQPLAPETIDV